MFGIGKLLGGIVGGVLDKIGLGKIAPFVKMGINALTGNWLGVAKDVFDMVSNFKSNPLKNAATTNPLGGFADSTRSFNGNSQLNGKKMSGFMRGLKSLFSGFKALMGGDTMGGMGKIFNAFKTLNDVFSNNQLYSNRQSSSFYSGMTA